MNFLIKNHMFSRDIKNYSFDRNLNLQIYFESEDPAVHEHIIIPKKEVAHLLHGLLMLFN